MAIVQSERGRGPRKWAWVLFGAVIIVIVWFIAGGIGNSRKVAANEPTSQVKEPQVAAAPGREAPTPAAAENGGLVTDLSALLNMNQEQLVNHPAQLTGANVLHRLGSNAFFVGSGGTQRLLVVPSQGPSRAIKPGEAVDVRGTIKKLPSEHDAMKQWNLSSTDTKMLRDMQVYLDANEVKASSK
jgi:hypothetical protein